MKNAHKLPKYFFNEFGLRFSIQYLTMMKKYIKELPVKEQAEFVDMVTYENTKIGRTIITAVPRMSDLNGVNVTGIGNAAFISLYHPDENQRSMAEKALSPIKMSIR